MKHLLFPILLILMLTQTPADAQDFKTLYSGTASLAHDNNSKVLYGSVRPVWRDGTTFLYRTSEASGEVVYEVNTAACTKVVSSADSLNALLSRQPKPYYVDIEDEDQFGNRIKAEPTVSPDGRWEAFVKNGNVWLRDLSKAPSQAGAAPVKFIPGRGPEKDWRPNGLSETESDVQLSFDGTQADYYNQLYWSPDSRHLAAVRFHKVDERQIPLTYSSPDDQLQPRMKFINYAKPGDALSQSAFALFDIDSRRQIPVDMAPFDNQYGLMFGQWSPGSDFFTFEYNRRGHQLYQVATVSAVDGAVKVAVEEKSETFVYYADLYRHYLKDGEHMLWVSERDDWRHLYMVGLRDGSLRQLTSGAWNVREVLDVNEEDGYILFCANGMNAVNEKGGVPKGEDPYNKHLLKYDIASGNIKDLTPENAWHRISLSPGGKTFVDVMSRPDLPPVTVVRDIDGAKVMDLQKCDISLLKKTGWTMPEVFVAKGRDGVTDIWGTIFRPRNFDPHRKYPVIEYIYAGPHDSHVDKEFNVFNRGTKLTELGFIVVMIDGMGTDNRSKSFQDVCWRNLKDAGFPDRILWMKAAAKKYGYMDLSRVGIFGYSAGGQNSLAALLFFGDFYKVAVPCCGCHDNRMDKIWWNELWMGWPIGPWYSENSNVDNAWRLRDDQDLLLINGEVDNNVDPASTLQVVNALVKADKDFCQYYMPMHSHNLGEEWVTRHICQFFYEKIINKKTK